jgi:hypothetical protein
MARRTIVLPDAVEALVRDAQEPGESFSAAVTRLVEAGVRSARSPRRPSYVGAGDGPTDLARRAEEYLSDPATLE